MSRIGYIFYFFLILFDITNYAVFTNPNTSNQQKNFCNLGIRRQRTLFRNLRKLMHSGSKEFSIPVMAPYVVDKFDIE